MAQTGYTLAVMVPLIIACAAIAATFLGGLFALRFRDKLHLILGFSAGAVIGLAFFDLIPESLDLSVAVYSPEVVLTAVALGFGFYMILDRILILHGSHDDECHNEHHNLHGSSKRGIFAAASLSVHSFLDGIAIGLAFGVSPSVGVVVAAAVLTHDFSDGINTVNLIVKEGGVVKEALRWLVIDALAPALGVIFALNFHIEQSILGLILALFAGFFLYIGASDLLPESHHGHPMKWTTVMTLLGMAVLYAAVRLAAL